MNPKVLIVVVCLFQSCGRPPIPPPKHAGQENGCLPDAIEMVQGLHDAGIQAEVIRMDFPAPMNGHAVAAYIYPPGSNKIYVWDKPYGSMRVNARFNDPMGIAQSYAFHAAAPVPTFAEILN